MRKKKQAAPRRGPIIVVTRCTQCHQQRDIRASDMPLEGPPRCQSCGGQTVAIATTSS